MLRARLGTAAVAIPLLLVLIWWAPLPWFVAFVWVITILGLHEFAAMAFPQRAAERWLTMLLGGTVAAAICFLPAPATAAAVALATILGLSWVLLGRSDFEAGVRDLGIMLLGVLYVGVLAPHFALLHTVPATGRFLVLFVIAVGMAGDSSGYGAGHLFGKHKLMPRVSPGKTIEGALGIMLGSLAGAAISKLLWLPGFSWTEILTLAAIMGVLGQLGDLCESVLKRTYGIKESGTIFPGHGGVLDRIDSLLFPVVFLYYHTSQIL